MQIRKHPGSTSRDILDHIQPIVRRKPDEIIIHAGTNDLTNEVNLLNNVKKIVKDILTNSATTRITFSSIVSRYDSKELMPRVVDVNNRLKNYCQQQDIGFIDNTNIGVSDLNSRKLHLNRKGNSKLTKNILEHLSSR